MGHEVCLSCQSQMAQNLCPVCRAEMSFAPRSRSGEEERREILDFLQSLFLRDHPQEYDDAVTFSNLFDIPLTAAWEELKTLPPGEMRELITDTFQLFSRALDDLRSEIEWFLEPGRIPDLQGATDLFGRYLVENFPRWRSASGEEKAQTIWQLFDRYLDRVTGR